MTLHGRLNQEKRRQYLLNGTAVGQGTNITSAVNVCTAVRPLTALLNRGDTERAC